MSWAGRNMAEWCEEHRCDQSECEADHELVRLGEIERRAGELANIVEELVGVGMDNRECQVVRSKAHALAELIKKGELA